MKKIIFLMAIVFLWPSFNLEARTYDENLTEKLRGKIILNVEGVGEAFYVDPTELKAYYLGRPVDAFNVMRKQGLGVSNDDLSKIPLAGTAQSGDWQLRSRLSGKILLQVEENGEAWYVNPDDKKRYFLGRPADAFKLMRSKGLGVSKENLDSIPKDIDVNFNRDEYNEYVRRLRYRLGMASDNENIDYEIIGDYQKESDDFFTIKDTVYIKFTSPLPDYLIQEANLITSYGASVPLVDIDLVKKDGYWQTTKKIGLVADSQRFDIVFIRNNSNTFKKSFTLRYYSKDLLKTDYYLNNYYNWRTESSGPGLEYGVLDTYTDDYGKRIINMNSLKGGNYYMEKAYYYPIETTADLNKIITWDWQQTYIDSPYGLVSVVVMFLNDDVKFSRPQHEYLENVIGAYEFRHHTGGFDKYNCSSLIAESDLAKKDSFGCQEKIGQEFDWQMEIVNVKELLDNKLIGVNQSEIKSIKILIVSYNNAGAGADASWSNFTIK